MLCVSHNLFMIHKVIIMNIQLFLIFAIFAIFAIFKYTYINNIFKLLKFFVLLEERPMKLQIFVFQT